MVTTPTIWKAQEQINLTDAGNQFDPAVISIGNGRYLMAWNETGDAVGSSAGQDIVGQIFDALGNPIGPEFQLNTAAVDGNQSNINLAGRPGGGFVIAYDTLGAGSSIHVETYDVDGKLVPGPTTIATGEPGAPTVIRPGMAMAADGSYLVAYQHGVDDILGRVVDAAGNLGAEFAIRDGASLSQPLSVAALSDGKFVVAYTIVGGDPQFNLVTPGSPPSSAPAKDIAPGPGLHFDVHVAALGNGGFVAVYVETVAGNSDIRAAVYDNNGNVTKASFTVNATTAGEQLEPDVAALPDGGFVVAWDDNSVNKVMGQRYDASGNKVGDQFEASNTGDHSGPSIAVLDDGRFIVGFDRKGADNDTDVQGTIFDPRDKVITGTEVEDVITSLTSGAKVKGLNGADHLLGLDAKDKLIGNGGKDWLVGAGGKDAMKGGGGKDCFVFNAELDKKTNVDKIKDFKPGQDKIVLIDDIFEAVGAKLGRKELEIGRKAGDGNDYVIVKEGKKANKVFFDADGKGGSKQVLFAKVDDEVTLKHKDFMVLDDLVI